MRPADAEAEARRRSLRPLRTMLPYMLRYRGKVAGALFFLSLAALTTLTLPLAVRRMIDHGFTGSDDQLIANYFSMLIVIAVVLAAASAGRYYFVITLGERVVSDVRRDVFAHVARLSPGFFDTVQSGEIVSRLTADTTQIKSTVGATASLALRNTILCIGAIAMMVVTSPKLASMVLLAIPAIVLPLVAAGRGVRKRSQAAQDTLAEAAKLVEEHAREVELLLGARTTPDPVRGLPDTFRAAYTEWLPEAGLAAVAGIEFEYMDARFLGPDHADSVVALYIPVSADDSDEG